MGRLKYGHLVGVALTSPGPGFVQDINARYCFPTTLQSLEKEEGREKERERSTVSGG